MAALYLRTALDLAQDTVTGDEVVRLRVDGNSMAPLVRPGDVLVVQAVLPQSLRVGDLVVVRRPQDLVAHRLVRIDSGGWRTKGDHQPFIDPALPGNSILGRVITIEHPGGQAEDLNAKWAATNRRLAWLSAWEGDLVSWAAGHDTGGISTTSRMRSVLRRAVSAPFRAAVWWAVFLERRRV